MVVVGYRFDLVRTLLLAHVVLKTIDEQTCPSSGRRVDSMMFTCEISSPPRSLVGAHISQCLRVPCDIAYTYELGHYLVFSFDIHAAGAKFEGFNRLF